MVRLDPCLECATPFAERFCQVCVIREAEAGICKRKGRVFLPRFEEKEIVQQ